MYCLATNDTADSISAGNHIAYTMTAAQAGVVVIWKHRSVGDSVDKGRVVHSGRDSYKYFESAVKSTNSHHVQVVLQCTTIV